MLTDRPQTVRPVAPSGGADAVTGTGARTRPPTITRLAQSHDGTPGKTHGRAPPRAVLPRTGRQGAPRPGSPSRPRRLLLRPPSGLPTRPADGCRPPEHLGVVPDGRAAAERVTVDRRRAPGVFPGGRGAFSHKPCPARSRAVPHGPARRCCARPGTGRPTGTVATARAACGPRVSRPRAVSRHRGVAVRGRPARYDDAARRRVARRRVPWRRTTRRRAARRRAARRLRHVRTRPDRHDLTTYHPTTHDRRRRMRIHPRQVKPVRPCARVKAVTRGTR